MKSAILELSVVLEPQLYILVWVIIQQTVIMFMKIHQFLVWWLWNISFCI